jgi:rubredoxin
MNYWMCNECNYVFKAETPPETCPGCHAKCTFMNVSCYIPECGGPGRYDPKLVARRAQESKTRTK